MRIRASFPVAIATAAVIASSPGGAVALGSRTLDMPGADGPEVASVSLPGTITAAGVPTFGHIFVVVMENKEASRIIGNAAAPYINSLIHQFGLATNYTAVSHPSEPNYFALWAGTTRSVTTDGKYNFSSGSTLADEIGATGRSWHVAAQNVPLNCYSGFTASGGEDGAGTYARKHEPAISWTSVSQNATNCARITDFAHFNPTTGNLWFIAPNLCNDMHDCSVAHGDAFLKAFLPRIMNSSAWSTSVIFLTWDEGSTTIGGGGKVATIVISPYAKSGFTSATSHNHYSLVRTIDNAWAMPCLHKACYANNLSEFFK